MSANMITNIRIGDLSNLLTSFYRKVAKINNPIEKKFKNTLKMNCSKG